MKILLDNDHKTNKETTLTATEQILNKQQLNYNRGTAFSTWSMLSIISKAIGALSQGCQNWTELFVEGVE
jgi:hypothetical protein